MDLWEYRLGQGTAYKIMTQMLWKCKLHDYIYIIYMTEMSGNEVKSQHNCANKKNKVKQNS